MRKNQKWIFDIKTGNGSCMWKKNKNHMWYAALAQIKDDIKQMKKT